MGSFRYKSFRGMASAAASFHWYRYGLRVPCVIWPKWSLPTRLETRTKESIVHASMPVEKPSCVMKVIDANLGAASTDHFPLVKGLSMSVSARTRKMVNYA